MNINSMTRKDFEALPYRKSWNEPIICASLVIFPTRRKHDSGYRCMDFIAIDENNEPICKLSGCSDVLHFDGIGGYGHNWLEKYHSVPKQIPPSGWSMDCLTKSGLLRIWPNTERIYCGVALSSFEIYALRD